MMLTNANAKNQEILQQSILLAETIDDLDALYESVVQEISNIEKEMQNTYFTMSSLLSSSSQDSKYILVPKLLEKVESENTDRTPMSEMVGVLNNYKDATKIKEKENLISFCSDLMINSASRDIKKNKELDSLAITFVDNVELGLQNLLTQSEKEQEMLSKAEKLKTVIEVSFMLRKHKTKEYFNKNKASIVELLQKGEQSYEY